MELIQDVFIPLVEIGVIAVILNYILSFFWNTKAMDIIFGFLLFLLIFSAASWLHLPVLRKLMLNVMNVVVLAVFIIFQPELRIAFSRLWSVKGRRYPGLSDFDEFLEGLVYSTYRLAEKRIGALIVLENTVSLNEFIHKGIKINADFSSELLESIFMTTTPLHDGAVVIRDRSVAAASVILPLADDISQFSRSMGTRHRAALGVSQITDALIIVVSEESGKVSIARDGIITRGVKLDKFRGILRSIYNPPQIKKSLKFWEWFRK
jgi:diadenylate cyclase